MSLYLLLLSAIVFLDLVNASSPASKQSKWENSTAAISSAQTSRLSKMTGMSPNECPSSEPAKEFSKGLNLSKLGLNCQVT